jgi:Sulfite exporter TauE/SafE
MAVETRAKTESTGQVALSSNRSFNWRASRSHLQWSILLVATAICLAFSSHEGLKPLVIGAILLASAISSIAGFAFSAVCGAMLFHLSGDPVQIVQIMIVCSIANQTAMVFSLRRVIRWRELTPFLIGGAFGLPFGIAVLLKLDRHVYTHVLGAFLVAYGCYMLVRKPFLTRVSRRLRHHLVRLQGMEQGTPARYVPAVHSDHADSRPVDHQSSATHRQQAWFSASGSALHPCCTSRNDCWHGALRAAVR